MTKEELEREVWEIVDNHSFDMSKEDYLDFLNGLKSDATTRAEAVEMELEDGEDGE